MNVLPIYENHFEAISKLPEDTQGEIYRAITTYAFTGEVIEMDAVAEAIFLMIKPSIDISKARAEAGAKGGKAKAEDKQEKIKAEAKPKQTESKDEPYKILNIKDETLNIKPNNNTPKAHVSEFEVLWNMYPRKEGRKQAFEYFKKAIHDGCTFEEMKAGIEQYCRYIKLHNIEPRYIKQGSTYFSKRAWQDELNMKPENEAMDFMQRTDNMEDVLMDL